MCQKTRPGSNIELQPSYSAFLHRRVKGWVQPLALVSVGDPDCCLSRGGTGESLAGTHLPWPHCLQVI